MSTGLASLNEIQRAYKVIKKYHNKIIILHCVSAYPTPIEEANIERIDFLKKNFKNNLIGLSDHTNNILSSLTASAKRITVIEKHFKLKNITSVDSEFSINESELNQLRSNIDCIEDQITKDIIGEVDKIYILNKSMLNPSNWIK